jgi:N-acetyl sugar amidotransferase
MRYQICIRCIMDTSDPDIRFDDSGVCNHCHEYDRVMRDHVFTDEEGKKRLGEAVARIRQEGEGKRYDCIIGLSGGVDSSYVAWMVKSLRLRPLAVHLDNGWDTEVAVRNIENIVKILGIDLYTEVLDWEEFRSLQVAFLRASTPDSEIPTDHAIVASLYRAAIREGVRYIVSGGNFVTELMVPLSWSNGHSDWKYIRIINERFGDRSLRSYPHYTFFEKRYVFPRIRKIEVVSPLNWIEYDKFKVMEFMKRELGWVPYGGKHHESLYTRFYQGYILPRKFGADKRRPHLSCLINDKRITRDDALREMQRPAIDDDAIEHEKDFVVKKLGLSAEEFEKIMAAPPRKFSDFPSDTLSPPSYERALRRGLSLARSTLFLGRRAMRSPGAAARAALRGLRRLASS